jgi:riboflavin synthase
MFAGIVQAQGEVQQAESVRGIRRVRIGKPARWKLSLGQSIAVDGICSTVVKTGKTFFDVDYMAETLGKTTAGALVKGRMVNLERSLKLKDFVDGHFVQGHVDARGSVAVLEARGDSRRVEFAIPRELMRYVAPRGSITVNGVALTVAEVTPAGCIVALIPHTLAHTNLGTLKKGDEVNIETDLVARYRAAALGGTVRRNAAKRIHKKG